MVKISIASNANLVMPHLKLLLSTVLALLLSACGGSTGFPPTITGVKPLSLMYGKTATIHLGGKDLRSSLVVESNGACINPSFASNSTTDTLVLNCLVKQAGDFVLTVKSDTGAVVYTGTLTVPAPGPLYSSTNSEDMAEVRVPW